MVRLFLFLTLVLNTLNASYIGYSDFQISNLKIGYFIGKNVRAVDGMTFEVATATIQQRESSSGNSPLGDQYIKNYYILHNNKRIFIKDKKLISFIEKQKSKKKHIYYKNYYKKVRILKVLKPLTKSSLGKYHVQLKTAKYLIRKYKFFTNFKHLLKKDERLAIIISTNDFLCGNLAAYYLKDRYELALKLKLKEPYFRAISAYNGGWYNKAYIKAFKRDRKDIRKIIHKYKWSQM